MAETDQVTDTWPGFPDRFADIVEVRPTSFKRANLFIAAGYRLLGIHSISRAGKLPNGSDFVERFSQFIVGRPSGIDVLEISFKPKAEEAES